MRRVITLTTDFGEGSPYVAQMKAAALGINPELHLVDVTHRIEPQNVRQGALVLDEVTRIFPPGTIHVAVVDPGVGTSREIVYLQFGQQHYIGPDNGLFSLLAQRQTPERIVALQNPQYWRAEVSFTFHGRDIMAPVAAHLSLGVDPQQLGPLRSQIQTLPWPEVRQREAGVDGRVLLVDSFGNLISNIRAEQLPLERHERFEVACEGQQVAAFVRTYGQRSPGELVALIGSSGRLEVAVVNGNAAQQLRLGEGAMIAVRWS